MGTNFLTSSQAAKVLGVTRRTVLNLAQSGALATAGTADSGGRELLLFDPETVRMLAEERKRTKAAS